MSSPQSLRKHDDPIRQCPIQCLGQSSCGGVDIAPPQSLPRRFSCGTECDASSQPAPSRRLARRPWRPRCAHGQLAWDACGWSSCGSHRPIGGNRRAVACRRSANGWYGLELGHGWRGERMACGWALRDWTCGRFPRRDRLALVARMGSCKGHGSEDDGDGMMGSGSPPPRQWPLGQRDDDDDHWQPQHRPRSRCLRCVRHDRYIHSRASTPPCTTGRSIYCNGKEKLYISIDPDEYELRLGLTWRATNATAKTSANFMVTDFFGFKYIFVVDLLRNDTVSRITRWVLYWFFGKLSHFIRINCRRLWDRFKNIHSQAIRNSEGGRYRTWSFRLKRFVLTNKIYTIIVSKLHSVEHLQTPSATNAYGIYRNHCTRPNDKTIHEAELSVGRQLTLSRDFR